MDIIDELYIKNIGLAKLGDKDSSKWLIKNFCDTIKENRSKNGNIHIVVNGKNNTKFNEDMLDYFRSCFEDILEYSPADIALGLNKGRSGADVIPKERLIQREVEWCLEVIKLNNSGKYSLLKNAQEQAARHFRVSVSAIEKAWKNKVSKYAALISFELSKEGK